MNSDTSRQPAESPTVQRTAMTMPDGGPAPVQKTAAAPAAAGLTTLEPGRMLGKCRIERELGRGGMGAVYLARHTTLDVPVAVKILPQEIAARDPQFAERFMREARLACRIKHANVITVMDAERDDASGLYYIVQEFVDGGTVRDLIRKGPLTEAQALDIALGVAEALAAAAEFGIVHRDIKPENIMLTRKGEVKLADLGIAKEKSDEDGLTVSRVMMGTPAYMAPEQASDAKNVDARADIYSLGASLYHMLCGTPPYTGDTAYAILTKLATTPTPDPRAKCPALSAATGGLILRMMDKDKEKRPQSARELVAELKALRNPNASAAELQKMAQELISEMRAIRSSTTAAAPTPAVSAPAAPPLSRRFLLPALAGVVVLAAVILGALMLKDRSDRAAPPPAGQVSAGTPAVTAPGTGAPPGATPTAVSAAATPADVAALRRSVDGLLAKALDEQALANPDVRRLFDNPVRFVSDRTRGVDPALVVRELVEKRVQIKDVFALLGKPRVGIDIGETVVGKDGIAARDSKMDRFRTALKNSLEQQYGLFVVDVTGDRAQQKTQCDILISGNVETAYFGEAVPPAIAAAGGSTALISYNTGVKVRFLNAVTNQDVDSSILDFAPKGEEKYCGMSNGEAIKNSINGAIATLLPEWMKKLEGAWVNLRIQAAVAPEK